MLKKGKYTLRLLRTNSVRSETFPTSKIREGTANIPYRALQPALRNASVSNNAAWTLRSRERSCCACVVTIRLILNAQSVLIPPHPPDSAELIKDYLVETASMNTCIITWLRNVEVSKIAMWLLSFIYFNFSAYSLHGLIQATTLLDFFCR